MLTPQSPSGFRDDSTSISLKKLGVARLPLFASFFLLVLGAGLFQPVGVGRAIKAEGVWAHQEEPEELTLTLRQEGFDPAEVVRAAGSFMLAVDNRSGVESLNFILKRADGNKVLDIKVSNRTGDWSEMIDLRPGRYTLSEVDHPDWKCTFLIKEKT